mgnify:CR=1 FL=1
MLVLHIHILVKTAIAEKNTEIPKEEDGPMRQNIGSNAIQSFQAEKGSLPLEIHNIDQKQ